MLLNNVTTIRRYSHLIEGNPIPAKGSEVKYQKVILYFVYGIYFVGFYISRLLRVVKVKDLDILLLVIKAKKSIIM